MDNKRGREVGQRVLLCTKDEGTRYQESTCVARALRAGCLPLRRLRSLFLHVGHTARSFLT